MKPGNRSRPLRNNGANAVPDESGNDKKLLASSHRRGFLFVEMMIYARRMEPMAMTRASVLPGKEREARPDVS